METVVYFIKHSELTPKSNVKYIKTNDTMQEIQEKAFLSVSGEKKAEELSKKKELQNIDAVYSSDYVSALQTAKYFALENNTILHIDDRFNERKVGNIGEMEIKEFRRLQTKDFDFKLASGESLNQTKKRIVDAVKNVLMFEAGNRVVVVSHRFALTCLLSAWCEQGRNYDDDIILTYKDETIIDGNWPSPMVVKVIFDGMNVTSIEYLDII